MIAGFPEAVPPPRPVPIILDTDIGPDCDDAGAIAVLNALADLGEAKLLAMACCTSDQWGAPCVQAINTYYGRGDIPVGTCKRTGFLDSSPYNGHVAQEFPNALKTGHTAPDARDVYREVLAKQPDHSVVFCAIGPLNNLADLLATKPDAHSPLDGKALVAQKVRLLVDMGGGFPGGKEWNFEQDVPAAQAVAHEWPTPIIFSGYEIGDVIDTGARLYTETPKSNPVRRAYEIYTNSQNRDSWDLTAALCAVRGVEPYWTLGGPGRCHVKHDGGNEWEVGHKSQHAYLVAKMPLPEITKVIEDLLVQAPKHGH